MLVKGPGRIPPPIFGKYAVCGLKIVIVDIFRKTFVSLPGELDSGLKTNSWYLFATTVDLGLSWNFSP